MSKNSANLSSGKKLKSGAYAKKSIKDFGRVNTLIIKHLLVIMALLIGLQTSAVQSIHIGVLALRGKKECLKIWHPLTVYLDSVIDGYNFKIVPLDFEETEKAVKERQVDFIFTNPALYADLEALYGIDRIATLQRYGNNIKTAKFGGVIFTLKSGDIHKIKDLYDKKIAAVNRNSFGGLICQIKEMKNNGLPIDEIFKNIYFTGTHDAVVKAVLNKNAAAGFVRTGILEKMNDNKLIDTSVFRVLNMKKAENFPYLLSTDLYPEWPMATLKHTPASLAKKVAVALLTIDESCKNINKEDCFGWVIPQDYIKVHNCLKDLHIKPYDKTKELTLRAFFSQHRLLFSSLILLIITLSAFLIYIIVFNKKIKSKNEEIKKSHDNLENEVEKRTKELNEKNLQLSQEIKQRKIIEHNLKKLSLVVEQYTAIIIITDRQGVVEYVNPAYETVTGYPPEKITGKRHPVLNDPTEKYKSMWDELNKGNIWRGVISEKNKKGEDIEEFISVFPLFDDKGTIINFVAIIEDITVKKEIISELRKSELRFKLLFDALGDAVFVTGVGEKYSGKIYEVNKSAIAQTGYSREELLNMNIIDDLTVEGTSQFITQNRELELKTGRSIRLTEKKRRKDGSEYWTEVTVSPFEYKGKSAALSINRDITERKKAEKELLKALEKATESDRLKKAFLQNVSHEIRTPMNGILSFYNLLKTANIKENQKESIFRMMAESGQRMIETLDNLMIISMAETGNITLKISKFSLNEIISQITTYFKDKIENKGLQLHITDTEEAKYCTLNNDREKLLTVINNLLNNAIKFTHTGSISISFSISEINKDKMLTVVVKDTGIGIPKDKQEAVFERFIQADTEDKYAYQGSGLGLTISKLYVEMMHGYIGMKSEEGKGSEFYFSIPLIISEIN